MLTLKKKWLKKVKNSDAAASATAAAAAATTSTAANTAETPRAPKRIGGLGSHTAPYIPEAQAADDVFGSMSPPRKKSKSGIMLNIGGLAKKLKAAGDIIPSPVEASANQPAEKTVTATKHVDSKKKRTTKGRRHVRSGGIHDGFSQLPAAETDDSMDVDN
jgi:hypothetical protein